MIPFFLGLVLGILVGVGGLLLVAWRWERQAVQEIHAETARITDMLESMKKPSHYDFT